MKTISYMTQGPICVLLDPKNDIHIHNGDKIAIKSECILPSDINLSKGVEYTAIGMYICPCCNQPHVMLVNDVNVIGHIALRHVTKKEHIFSNN